MGTEINQPADGRVEVGLVVNGKSFEVRTWPMARLLDVLREDCGLTGTKEGCGEGECGACSILMDGVLVNACLIPALQADGAAITTIEGLAREDGRLHPLQAAFVRKNGAQCGICTPGMVLAAAELLKKHPRPDDTQLREGLAGNLCRCTGYMRIFEAVREAAQELEAEAAPTGGEA
jgi:carbon-monoxide dehydrogenase small subunit